MDPTASPVPEWLLDAVRDAAVGRRQRVLVLGDLPAGIVHRLHRAVGVDGEMVAPHLASDRREASAGRVAARCFDLVFAAPIVPHPQHDLDLVHAHTALRPGGRIVLDLPAENWSDDLWRLQPLLGDLGLDLAQGFAAEHLRLVAQRLRLRDVELTARTCLHLLTEPDDLTDLALLASPDRTGADVAAARLAVLELLGRRPPPLQTVLRRLRFSARR